jgi:chloramphenicol O-acetyltransferase
MFYLWRFKRNWDSRDELLRRIRNNTLWLSLPATINDFEGVFNYVWRTLNNPKIPQIAQLAIYDISIRLAYLHQNKNLLPKDVVYIHALPMRAFNLLIKNKHITGVKKNIPQVPYGQLTSYFPDLSAFQIEDLLCQLGKSLRRIKNGKSSVKAADWDIDSIVRKYRLLY